ncbi:transposase [Chryseobacterium soli]|uniref:Transposase n=1 Tax=Chryseobacterium soli TaxID=445961 RepID=A0A085ZZB2_9FLAO|nr:hypothetical protein [Chryseobacterium soli]KFF09776.1 transposase [Chryseobacterium soli]
MKQNPDTYPDYKAIYKDILIEKFPDKIEKCLPLLDKKRLSAIDILNLNQKIFGQSKPESSKINQQLHSYCKDDILQILGYQKKHKLNNTKLANHFKLSRNTVAKWKRIFLG